MVVAIASFVILMVEGFQNRPAPRWLAIPGLIALVPIVNESLWRVTNCYSKRSVVEFAIWIAAICAMYLHQIIQHPAQHD